MDAGCDGGTSVIAADKWFVWPGADPTANALSIVAAGRAARGPGEAGLYAVYPTLQIMYVLCQ